MKKKICMIVPSFTAKGGIASVVSGYKNSRIEDGYDINYIETYCEGNKFLKVIKALGSYFKFIRITLKEKPDLVHIHSSFGGSFYRKIFFVYLSHFSKIPVINHIHGSEIDKLYTNASRRKKRLVEKTFDKCSVIIVLSEEWIDKLSIIKTNTPKVVLQNYSTLHEDALECGKGSNIVLFLGFLSKLKGCYDIPEIVKSVKEIVPNVKFILGGVGDQNTIQQKMNLLNVKQYVEFPGWVNDEKKDILFRKASVFLLPSYTEAMPMSILEAMGYGIPIVSTDVGGIPQLVKNDVNGFLFTPGDTQGMAQAISKLLLDNHLKQKFGYASYKCASKLYSKDTHMERLCKIYNEVLNNYAK